VTAISARAGGIHLCQLNVRQCEIDAPARRGYSKQPPQSGAATNSATNSSGGDRAVRRRRVLGKYTALAQDRDAVTDLIGLVDVVRDEERRSSATFACNAEERVLEIRTVIGSIAPNGSSINSSVGLRRARRATRDALDVGRRRAG